LLLPYPTPFIAYEAFAEPVTVNSPAKALNETNSEDKTTTNNLDILFILFPLF